MSIAVEIAVEDLAGLEVAARAGADRVELCTDLDRGGLTPPPALVEACTDRAAALVAAQEARPHFDVHVLIRCRAEHGDFLDRPAEFAYRADEIALMARQAEESVTAGAAGVVIGALDEDGLLDVPALETIRDGALTAGSAVMRGVTLTLHRAVDALPDRARRAEAVQTALRLGMHRVLSSGGAARSLDGAEDLAAMVEAAEDLLEICAGGGVRPVDVGELARRGGVGAVHLSARRRPGAPVEDGAPATRTDPAIVAATVDAAGEL
ncbi:copper homeostasis protein CutC [Brachybacterium saurashtrense]|uniref:PF03932 family protein CutC n=1 Tax=Brachybacterium saurashtrense TaxID=556288 RepID=A0A345YKL3_9MICO|nr:copper homeostasis protein CutC [Brachybacterium saurashtrense]AXK44465.1 copper resistance protein [Brachybacterium saurashtrense]RRR23077.1 copper resistance protein [Brachybacterium saurashtrense]